MKNKFRILIIGSGGREHAMAWSFTRDTNVEKVFCAPGNGGTASLAENVKISINDFDGLIRFVRQHNIDFTVVGPELPLSAGIVDHFDSEGELIFGPTQSTARLESSKIFAREFMERNHIPQPKFIVCDSLDAAREAQKTFGFPLVVKADGLAAGKGVIICNTESEFDTAMDQMFTRQVFGTAGERITIEEFLEGEELSVFAVCDGDTFVVLNTAQDHKRIFEEDEGPNTGGMGAYSPTRLATPELMSKIESLVLIPTLAGLKKEGTPYKGFLYAGIMVVNGEPYVIEYNVRLGDPETQVVLPLLKSSFAELLFASLQQELHNVNVEISSDTAVTVVLAVDGYPGKYPKGMIIEGLEECAHQLIFHAGTERRSDQTVVTTGGRVLNVCGLGQDLSSAIRDAYSSIGTIRFDHMIYRRDIGQRGLRYLLRKQDD